MVFKLHRLTIVCLSIMIVYNIKIINSQQRKVKLLHHQTVENLKKNCQRKARIVSSGITIVCF